MDETLGIPLSISPATVKANGVPENALCTTRANPLISKPLRISHPDLKRNHFWLRAKNER
jgi:hypothetical protein